MVAHSSCLGITLLSAMNLEVSNMARASVSVGHDHPRENSTSSLTTLAPLTASSFQYSLTNCETAPGSIAESAATASCWATRKATTAFGCFSMRPLRPIQNERCR